MGCTSSKQQLVESDMPLPTSISKSGFFGKLKPLRQDMHPPSAVVEAPWVKGHGIFVLDEDGSGKYASPGP
jgi:hypothetical protein